MYTYENHVKNVKINLVTMDFGMVATFTTMCNSIGQENIPIKANLEYIRWIQDILELDYGMCYFAIGSKLLQRSKNNDEVRLIWIHINELHSHF
jgi:hypothetical protein